MGTDREEIRTDREEITAGLEANTDANNEKFEVLRGTLVSRLDIYQATIDFTQEKIKVKTDIHEEKMEAAIHFIWSEFETIKHRVEDVLSCVDQKMKGLRKELTQKTDETQVDSEAIRTSVDTRTNSLLETITDTREGRARPHNPGRGKNDEDPNRYLAARTRDQDSRSRRPGRAWNGEDTEVRRGNIMGRVPVPVRDRSRAQLWMRLEKSTYLITALQGRATYVLHRVPKGATYEENLEALEDSFGDQYLVAAFRSQLKTRTQGESLQEFATAVEQLAHRAYPALPEDHISREAGKAFADGIESPAIKIHLLRGGQKWVNEALRQTLELQDVVLAAKPKKNERHDSLGEPIAPNLAKRPKMIGVLELCGARQLPEKLPLREGGRKRPVRVPRRKTSERYV
jgi:hypothetical protein